MNDIFIYKSFDLNDNPCMGNERLKGELIAEWLDKKGNSYELLAAILGVSSSTARAMAKGYLPRERREEILDRLASLLEVNAATLVSPVRVA